MFLSSYRLLTKRIYPLARNLKVSNISGLRVRHDPEENKFYVDIGNFRAYLDYEREGKTMTILHTIVPPALEGHGLGKFLAKEALEYARQNDFRLKIECEFVQNYVLKNRSKYTELLQD